MRFLVTFDQYGISESLFETKNPLKKVSIRYLILMDQFFHGILAFCDVFSNFVPSFITF